MATRVFQLRQGCCTTERRHGATGMEIIADPNDCWLPHVDCPACGGHAAGDCDLPESLSLTDDHPLMQRLKAFWRRWRRQSRDPNTGLRPPMSSWAEYQSITAQVRDVLGLPPDRLLGPCTQLGPCRYLVGTPPLPDVTLVQADHLVASPVFIEWLEREAIKGWAAEQVLLRYRGRRPKPEPDLRRLRITGRAGQPANVRGRLVCPVCGGVYNYRNKLPKTLRVGRERLGRQRDLHVLQLRVPHLRHRGRERGHGSGGVHDGEVPGVGTRTGAMRRVIRIRAADRGCPSDQGA